MAFRSKLDFSVDIEGAWNDQENKLLIRPFNYYRITKTIGRFKGVQKEIWPDQALIDDDLNHNFVPNHRRAPQQQFSCETCNFVQRAKRRATARRRPTTTRMLSAPADLQSCGHGLYAKGHLPGRKVLHCRAPCRELRPSIASGPSLPFPPGFPTLDTVLQVRWPFQRRATQCSVQLKCCMMQMKCDRYARQSERESLVIEVSGDSYNWPGGAKKVDSATNRRMSSSHVSCDRCLTVSKSRWCTSAAPARHVPPSSEPPIHGRRTTSLASPRDLCTAETTRGSIRFSPHR